MGLERKDIAKSMTLFFRAFRKQRFDKDYRRDHKHKLVSVPNFNLMKKISQSAGNEFV